MKRSDENNRVAFTLVELLVVIAIIALLLSILMPSLQKARQQGQRVVCGTGLKQIGIANVMYAQDYKGLIASPWTFQFGLPKASDGSYMWSWAAFRVATTVDGIRVQAMTPSQLQDKVFKTGDLYPYIKSSKVWLCPGAPRKVPKSLYGPYVPFGFPPYWSYVCNYTPGWTQNGATSYPPAGGTYPPNWCINPDRVKPGPAKVFLYMEQNRNLSSNKNDWDNTPFDNTCSGFGADLTYGPGGDSITDLHAGGGSISFYDGHMEFMQRRDFVKRMGQPGGSYNFGGNPF